MRVTLEDVEKEKKKNDPAGSDAAAEADEAKEAKEENQPVEDRRSFKEKLSYFWEYYKWYVIIPAIIVYIAISITVTLINEHKDAAIYVVFSNTSEVLDAKETILEDYVTVRGINTKKNPVVFADGIFYPAGINESGYMSQDTVSSMQKFTAMITNHKADVTFTTSWVADAYMLNDCFADLRDVFGEAFVEENADKIYYFDRVKAQAGIDASDDWMEDPDKAAEDPAEETQSGEEGEEAELIPVGIYAGNWSKLGRFYEDENPIMVIDAQGTNQEETIEFVKWVMQQE